MLTDATARSEHTRIWKGRSSIPANCLQKDNMKCDPTSTQACGLPLTKTAFCGPFDAEVACASNGHALEAWPTLNSTLAALNYNSLRCVGNARLSRAFPQALPLLKVDGRPGTHSCMLPVPILSRQERGTAQHTPYLSQKSGETHDLKGDDSEAMRVTAAFDGTITSRSDLDVASTALSPLRKG